VNLKVIPDGIGAGGTIFCCRTAKDKTAELLEQLERMQAGKRIYAGGGIVGAPF
jgi:preprotein translocase subunit YajC